MAAPSAHNWNLYLSPEHACHYLPNKHARIAVLDDQTPLNTHTLTQLNARGFRRSGPYVYRNACIGCNACQSLRIPVADFKPNRSQRRNLVRNRDISMHCQPPHFSEAQFALFQRYINARHPHGSMSQTDRETYINFLDSHWADTQFYEFRAHQRILAVAVVDRLDNGLSAVYTFFDPTERTRGLGIYAILAEIEWARAAGLEWLYLGYWVPGSATMDYKSQFKPHEVFTPHGWQYHTR